ncbi:MAG TPA: PhnD/SsuA/transferrin family substrate-binding protein [Gemmataceae bacterium]|jgi:ABC-type phosphate/phosphonate transport system substrate-binding protein|nr:PhnD/SsuA/transferrin family substrate-binding protein [Gemmataceae bacterium]
MVPGKTWFPRRRLLLFICALTILVVPALAGHARQAKIDLLRIGSSGSLTSEKKEESAQETLKAFIQEETGLSNEIVRLKDWRELSDKMVKGELHLGVYQGYEFAWAQEKQPQLKPLALAVNVYRYPVAYVVTQRESAAKDIAGLQGQSISIPAGVQRFLRLFVERESQKTGKKLEEFFSKITAPENVEDALDDVVDGVVQASVVDRAALEAYKRRKPGRFKKLKEVAHSQPFPPPLVAYYGDALDEVTRERFRQGLLNASQKDKGQTMLTLFRLTGFEGVPEDFDKVLTETRKNYPPTSPTTK